MPQDPRDHKGLQDLVVPMEQMVRMEYQALLECRVRLALLDQLAHLEIQDLL